MWSALCPVQVQFSPDGRWIATASFDKAIKVWDGMKGSFVGTLRAHVGPVYQIAWSSDSRLVASASKDSTLKVDIPASSAVGAGCDARRYRSMPASQSNKRWNAPNGLSIHQYSPNAILWPDFDCCPWLRRPAMSAMVGSSSSMIAIVWVIMR